MKKNKKIDKKSSGGSLMGKEAEKWQEILWDGLLDKLSKVKSKQELKSIIERLLSESEKKLILRRLAIIALVRQGKSHQEIGEILWISPATVSAIKKNLLSKSLHHRSHRFVYKNKNRHTNFVDTSKKSLSEKAADFVAQLVENAAREFFRSEPVTLTGYARSIRKAKNKS